MIGSRGNNGLRAGSRHAGRKPTWSVTRAIRRVTSHVCARPQPLPKVGRETDSRRRRSRRGPELGVATEETWVVGNSLYLQGRIAGSKVSFLVDTGSGIMILAAQIWREWDRPRDELAKYWGRRCSVEGGALKCLGRARLAGNLGTRVIEWDFIVAEIGEDEGILGNDFAMAQQLRVRPHESVVYLPASSSADKEDMEERLPCAVWSVAEVRAIMEEALRVRALRSMTLVPRTVSQVSVVIPTPRRGGTVMVEAGPSPLGLCPV